MCPHLLPTFYTFYVLRFSFALLPSSMFHMSIFLSDFWRVLFHFSFFIFHFLFLVFCFSFFLFLIMFYILCFTSDILHLTFFIFPFFFFWFLFFLFRFSFFGGSFFDFSFFRFFFSSIIKCFTFYVLCFMFNIKSLITTMAGELWGVVEGSCPCSGTSWTLSPCWPLLHVWKCTKAPVTGHFLCVSERSFSQFCLGHAPIHLTAGKEIEEIHCSHCHPMPTCSHALSCAVVMSIGPVFFLCCTCILPQGPTQLHAKSLPSPLGEAWNSCTVGTGLIIAVFQDQFI